MEESQADWTMLWRQLAVVAQVGLKESTTMLDRLGHDFFLRFGWGRGNEEIKLSGYKL